MPHKQVVCSESKGTWNFLKESASKRQRHVVRGQFFPSSNNTEGSRLFTTVPGVAAGASNFSLEKRVAASRLNAESRSASDTKCQGGSGGRGDELAAGETTDHCARGETKTSESGLSFHHPIPTHKRTPLFLFPSSSFSAPALLQNHFQI